MFTMLFSYCLIMFLVLYLSHVAMQNEYKGIRLEWHAIAVHTSYMMDEMSPDAIVPHLVERRLLSPAKAEEVYETSSQIKKVSTIIKSLQGDLRVGMLATFCAALVCAGQPHAAKKISNSEYMFRYSPIIIVVSTVCTEFQRLLKGEVVSHSADEDIMVSGEVNALPSPLPPDRGLITAQVEGTTLSRGQYNNISSLVSSMFYLPTGALEYAGHTLNPLTLYWHTYSDETEREVLHSTGLLSEMAHEGIHKIFNGVKTQIVIPKRNVSR